MELAIPIAACALAAIVVILIGWLTPDPGSDELTVDEMEAMMDTERFDWDWPER